MPGGGKGRRRKEMDIKKCDICGAEFADATQIREVQVRKRDSKYPTRLILEKSFDVCTSCINSIFDLSLGKPVPDRMPRDGAEGGSK